MRTLKIALLATAATAALSTATLAADLIIDAPAIYQEPAVASYGLGGPYAGLYVLGQSHPGALGIGVVLGVNMPADGFLLGIEGDAAITASSDAYGQVIGKIGLMPSEAVAIYGLAGVGVNSHDGFYVPVGAGVEFAVAENLSLKAQYEYQWDPDHTDNHVGKIGFNFRF